MREVIITLILSGFDQKNQDLTSVAKELKLKVRKFWGLIPTFVEVTWKKLVGGGAFLLLKSVKNKILNRVKLKRAHVARDNKFFFQKCSK